VGEESEPGRRIGVNEALYRALKDMVGEDVCERLVGAARGQHPCGRCRICRARRILKQVEENIARKQ
jgi:hypothetical protein